MRVQLFEFMGTKGLGVAEVLYNNSDPAAKQFVELVPSSAYASGYMLQPCDVVDAIGYITYVQSLCTAVRR